jgi:16S rRNA (cytosine1402-N4)-methyltransferase
MLKEAVACLSCQPGGIYVDGTLGGCGHARVICRKIMPNGRFIGIDQDYDAIANARHILKPFLPSAHIIHGNFAFLPDYLSRLDIPAVNGILLDLGLSQHQLEAGGRGFSFQKDEPLDMRMDVRAGQRAADLVNRFEEDQLVRIFKQYGQERWSKRIARALVEHRRREPVETSLQLAQVVSAAVPRHAAAKQKIHPATRVFMALRIAVNKELERLDTFLSTSMDVLLPGGRLCILSFHSLEDRMVKHRFRALATGCTCPPDLPVCACGKQPRARLVTRKVLRPGPEEVARNPMARSTRMRCIEKLPIETGRPAAEDGQDGFQ